MTLIGDAAHVAAPNGEGANLAMLDAAELAQSLATHPDDIETALTAYEQPMFPRSAETAAEGTELYAVMFGEDTPHGLIEMFTGESQPSN